ncbi:MAG: hypothetical protein ACP5KB_04910 [Thermoprotei archaeon]
MKIIKDFEELITKKSSVRHNLILVITLLVTTTLTTILPNHLLVVVAVAATLITTYLLRSLRQLLIVMKVFTYFILPFIVASTIVQYFLGILDTRTLMTSTLRLYTLYTMSVILVKYLNPKDLVSISRYLGLKYVLTLLIAFKLIDLGVGTLNELSELYGVNLGRACRGFKGRLLLLKLLTQSFTQLFVMRTLDIAESMYCRYRSLYRKYK